MTCLQHVRNRGSGQLTGIYPQRMLRLLSETATLGGELGFDREQTRSTLNQVIEIQSSLEQAQSQISGFREVLAKLPAMTGKMKVGKRNSVNALIDLDNALERVKAYGRVVIAAIEDLIGR